MTFHQIQLTEDCLYINKYLYGRIQELEIFIESILPQLPGSVLKIVGRPMAITPLDTSKTESLGIKRATCKEAEELYAKKYLQSNLEEYIPSLSHKDKELIRYLYDKEYPPKKVKNNLNMSHDEYYKLRLRILRGLWNRLKDNEDLLYLAVQ